MYWIERTLKEHHIHLRRKQKEKHHSRHALGRKNQGRSSHLVNVLSKAIGEGTGFHEQSVVLVGGLGEAHDCGELTDRLTVGHHRVRLLQRDASMVLFQVLEADL